MALAGQPLISVCIANYNGIDLLDACIDSVRAQRCDGGIEIIVHDDASTDASVAHLRERHADVVLIESAANAGFCVANNRMAAVAQGEYLLLLNNDATLLPGALEALLHQARTPGRQAILTLPQYDGDTDELLDNGSWLDPFLNPVPNRRMQLVEVGMGMGACLWLPAALWRELGGFPAWFGSVGEDLYLCCRARLAGHPVLALGVSGYRHRVGQSFGGGKARAGGLQTTFRRRALTERNKTFVMAMTYPAPLMQFVLPLHLLLLLVEGGLLSLLKGRSAYLRDIYLPAVAALYRQRGEWRAMRRTIMAGRRPAGTDFFAVFDPVPYKLRMLLRHGLPRVD